MWLFVGLGNPGPKYQLTRHNIGFLCVDHLLRGFPRVSEKSAHKSLVSQVQIDTNKVLLAKPQTFMNLSGDATRSLVDYYKIPTSQLVVIHDEVDLPFGKLKLQQARGHGGHNGIRDIHSKLGHRDYIRLRLGVGRSLNPKIDTASHVLQNFNESEMAELPDFLNSAGDALELIVKVGFEKAATQVNSTS